ncbi:hypothetical protein Tco_0948736 [Tanacetum coccineum]
MGCARSVLYVIMSPQSSRRGSGQEVAVTKLKITDKRWDVWAQSCLNFLEIPTLQIKTAQALKSLDSRYHRVSFRVRIRVPENLHPELPGLGDHIVDFLEVMAYRMAATKDDKPKTNTYSVVDVATLDTHQMDLFNLIKAPNLTKVKIGTRQRTAHEVPLLTATANRVIQMVDTTELSTSSGTPSIVERSPLDFSNKDAPLLVTQGAEAGVHRPTMAEQEILVTDDVEATVAARDAGEGGSKAPAKVLRKDHHVDRAEHSARRGKSLADMSVGTEPAIHVHETQEPPIATQSVSDPDPLSYAKPQPNPKQDVAHYADNIFSLFRGCKSSKEAGGAGNKHFENSTPSPSITRSPGSIYQPEWCMPNDCRLDTPEACQDVLIQHKPGEAMGYGLSAEVEIRAGGQTIEEIRGPARVMGEERIMAAFEVFKKHEDKQVNARCAEMDARLNALSIDFDEELYPHMLTTIADRRWVIGHGLRLAILKFTKPTELRRAFANVVSARISKGMSEGLKYGMEHGKAGLELTAMELEQLKDAPLDVIMATLYLKSDTGEDAPHFIRDLRPSCSKIKIPVYPEVRDPRNPWDCKEEIL